MVLRDKVEELVSDLFAVWVWDARISEEKDARISEEKIERIFVKEITDFIEEVLIEYGVDEDDLHNGKEDRLPDV